jgi:hypothetical protein
MSPQERESWAARLLIRSSAAAALATASAASAQGLGGGQDLDISLGRIVAAFLISIGVATACILAMRRRRTGGPAMRNWLSGLASRQPEVRIVETRRISQHGDICLVRSRDREYLLLVMAGQAQVLRESEIADAAATGAR